MAKITTYREGCIEASSFNAAQPQEIFEGQYDLIFLASSWDSRCLSLTKASGLKALKSILLLFDVKDKEGLREKHDAALRKYCKEQSDETIELTGKSLDVEKLWKKISPELINQRRGMDRPMRVFIDASSCPRYFVLAILGFCFNEGLSRNITICYGEALYPEKKEGIHGLEEVSFTGGHWRTVAIPSLNGTYSPEKKRHYLVSVGFEGWKTLRVVSRADPDRVSILFPDPGFKKGYADRTMEDNQDLVDQYRIPASKIIRSSAGDAINAWKALGESSVDRPDLENTFYLCGGTKAHSLALGLRSLSLGYPTVLYNMPEEHRVVKIEPSDNYWRFDITCLTVPS